MKHDFSYITSLKKTEIEIIKQAITFYKVNIPKDDVYALSKKEIKLINQLFKKLEEALKC
tara:strand:+ start:702 stop:881 length:180 start_codon:yes stop_codon:yes gene_type:complete